MEDKKSGSAEKSSSGFSQWWGGIRGEYKRINWPSRAELVKMVVTVIVTGGVFGGVIVFYDFVLAAGYDALAGLLR